MCTPRLVRVDFIRKQKVLFDPFSGLGAMIFAENKNYFIKTNVLIYNTYIKSLKCHWSINKHHIHVL